MQLQRLRLMLSAIVFLAVCFLAYANGANDNFKGVASLFGSRTLGYRASIAWATVTTFAGSLTAIFVAQSLLRTFSGKGLVPELFIGSPEFLIAVAIGAEGAVILAALLGFPISTTHGLTGALVGAGLVATGGHVNLGGSRLLAGSFSMNGQSLTRPRLLTLRGASSTLRSQIMMETGIR